MIRTSILLLTLLISGGWALKPGCKTTVPFFEIKQRQINAFVDTINKPIDTGFKSIDWLSDDRDLTYLGMLPKHQPFSLFDERYYKEVLEVVKLLTKAEDFDHFMQTAEALHERVNEDLLYYCLSVAVLHRDDTKGIRVPPVHKVYPDKFLKVDVIHRMKELVKDSSYLGQTPIIDATHDSINHLNPNNDLSYFLEDIGMNSIHHQWHVMYSPVVRQHKIDRKGELFYWMHKQMVNRYDAERLSNDKKPVTPFNNWDEPIEEGYAPHLRIDKLGYRYAYRPPHVVLRNLPDMTKDKMLLWEERLTNAALRGFARTSNGTIIELDEEHGIDVLGEMVESSLKSVNRKYYGNLHCYAHVIAGKITDPKDVYGGNYGVMYDVPTSARDPLFYAWHKYINRIFEAHKDSLPPYTKEELDFPDVKISKLTINSTEENVVHTSMIESIFKVPKGFTFTGKSDVGVKVEHLMHEHFTYLIEVENSGPPKKAVIRITAVPFKDGHNQLSFNKVRKTLIELDIFTTDLVAGHNVITRSAMASNLFTPTHEIFPDRSHRSHGFLPEQQCHCGWPHYMMLPRGNLKGVKFSIGVVINDWAKEKVDQESSCQCPEFENRCDIHHKLPSKRALGFPFDRKATVHSFEAFKTPNMATTVIKIKFIGKTPPPHSV